MLKVIFNNYSFTWRLCQTSDLTTPFIGVPSIGHLPPPPTLNHTHIPSVKQFKTFSDSTFTIRSSIHRIASFETTRFCQRMKPRFALISAHARFIALSSYSVQTNFASSPLIVLYAARPHSDSTQLVPVQTRRLSSCHFYPPISLEPKLTWAGNCL
jgi:hypothetical protein